MAKHRRTFWVTLVVMLVIAAIILGVLGGLGYFKKKSGTSPLVISGSGSQQISGSGSYIQPGETTCIAPTITNVDFNMYSNIFNVTFSPPVSNTCVDKYGVLYYHLQFYKSDGTSIGFSDAPQQASSGLSTIEINQHIVPNSLSAPNGWYVEIYLSYGNTPTSGLVGQSYRSQVYPSSKN